MKFTAGIHYCFRHEEFQPSVRESLPTVFLCALVASEVAVYATGEWSARLGLIWLPIAVAGLCILIVPVMCLGCRYEIHSDGIGLRGLLRQKPAVPWEQVKRVQPVNVLGLQFLRVHLTADRRRRPLCLPLFVKRSERVVGLIETYVEQSTARRHERHLRRAA